LQCFLELQTGLFSLALFFGRLLHKRQFERDLIRERTNAGLEAARARGKKGGRKRVLTDKQISIGKSLAADKSRSIKDICETLKISPATYYRYIHHEV
jgi:DNA invertase Pin-like site-specific DNA recombinase